MDEDRQASNRWSGKALLRLHPAVVAAVGAGILAFLVLTSRAFKADNFVFGWDAGATVYLFTSWYFMLTSSVDRLKQRANDIDVPDSQLLFFSLVAAAASLSVIFLLLKGVHQTPPEPLSARPYEAVGTIFLSWVFVHTLFTVHYAHIFYANDGRRGACISRQIASSRSTGISSVSPSPSALPPRPPMSRSPRCRCGDWCLPTRSSPSCSTPPFWRWR